MTPFDPGLQPERTLLAWHRTCLAIVATSAVVTRLSIERLGSTGAYIGLAGVVLAAIAYLVAGGRYDRAHGSLIRSGALPADGRSFALLSAAVGAAGAVAVAYISSR